MHICKGTDTDHRRRDRFYIQALLYDIQFTDTKMDESYRKELAKIAREKGNHFLHEMLAKVDPAGAEAIHENNVKRVIRALEYYKETGEPISVHNERERNRVSPYRFCLFCADARKTGIV